MSKEKFVVDVILKLRDRVWWPCTLKQFDLGSYGISRATAWRSLKALEECGYIEKGIRHAKDGDFGQKAWRLTKQFKQKLNQHKVEDAEKFRSNLDSILTFEDKEFQEGVRTRVYALLEKHMA